MGTEYSKELQLRELKKVISLDPVCNEVAGLDKVDQVTARLSGDKTRERNFRVLVVLKEESEDIRRRILEALGEERKISISYGMKEKTDVVIDAKVEFMEKEVFEARKRYIPGSRTRHRPLDSIGIDLIE